MRNIRRQQVKQKKKRRRLVFLTAGILFFIYLSLTLIFGENGLLRYIKLKSTKTNLATEIHSIEKQNEEIKRQIDTLKKNPDLIEELARELGLTKEGELTFKFEEDDEQ